MNTKQTGAVATQPQPHSRTLATMGPASREAVYGTDKEFGCLCWATWNCRGLSRPVSCAARHVLVNRACLPI